MPPQGPLLPDDPLDPLETLLDGLLLDGLLDDGLLDDWLDCEPLLTLDTLDTDEGLQRPNRASNGNSPGESSK
jgi:hypothetical protein